MACFVGTINLGTGAIGATYAGPVMPFTWTCVRLFASLASATGARRDNGMMMVGVSGGTSVNACVVARSQDSVAGDNTARAAAVDCCVMHVNVGGTTIDGKAKCQAPGTTVVLEVTDVFPAAFVVGFIAYDDVTPGTPIDITDPATTGVVQYAASGGTPDATQFMGVRLAGGAVSTHSIMTYGMGVSATEQFVCSFAAEDVGTSDTAWYNTEGECIGLINTVADLLVDRAVYDTYASGFELNWIQVAGTANLHVIAVPLYGGVWSVGKFDLATSATTINVTLDNGTNPPAGVVCFMNGNPAESTPGTLTDTGASDVRASVGAFTSTSSRWSFAYGDQDGRGTADIYRAHYTDAVLSTHPFNTLSPPAATTIASACDVNAVGPGAAFQMMMDTAAPSAYPVYYDAVEGAAPAVTSLCHWRRRIEGMKRRAD